MGVDHREFLMSNKSWMDYPEKGMWTLFMKNVTDERFPVFKGRVRATCHIMLLVCKPDVDSAGKDFCHVMLVTNVDINGLVPKWIVNLCARSAPTQWFNDC